MVDGPDLIGGSVAKDKRIGWVEEYPPEIRLTVHHPKSNKIVYGVIDFIKEAESNRDLRTGMPVLALKLDREGLFNLVSLVNDMLEEWNKLSG